MAVSRKGEGWRFIAYYRDENGQLEEKHQQDKNWKRKDAIAAEKAFLEQKEKEVAEKKLSKNIVTYNQLYESYLLSRQNRSKESTINTLVDIHKRHILPKFGALNVESITPDLIESWQRTLLMNGYNNSYLKQIQSHLRRVLKHGETYDYLEKNPFYRPTIVSHTEIKDEVAIYTAEEFAQYVSVIDDIQDKAMFSILFWCGLRKGELMALSLEDISIEEGVIRIAKTYNQRSKVVTTTKNKNGNREVPMNDFVKSTIEQLVDLKKLNPAFTDDSFLFGEEWPISFASLDRKNTYYAEKAGLKRINIHAFRHSYASMLLSENVDMFLCSKMLGHTVDQLTTLYGHVLPKSLSRVNDVLNQVANRVNL